MNEETKIDHTEVFQRQKNKEEMQKQLISFGLMIIFTLIAFGMVAAGGISKVYVIPVLFIMAVIQAGFQFYYFMHMKEKDHEMPATLIFGGVWAAFLTLCALMVITWW
ncbi:MAG TPA: cytochrome c oxidase subunit IVB [Pseudogracilibacillus sp.]|nr:cytochrome c oxidase subunit IVB [Pseudogracilibacillus sp.]